MDDKNWYKKQLTLLASLQKYYLSRFSIEDRKKRFFDLKDEKFENQLNLDQKLEFKKKQLDDLKRQLVDKNLDLKAYEDRFKGLEDIEKNVKTQKEYNSMNSEKITLEKSISELKEDAKLENRELVELELEVDDLKKLIEEEKKSFVKALKEIETQVKAMDDELLQVQSKKDNLLKKVDRIILQRFDIIIANKKDGAIVPVIDEVCQGCNIIVGPIIFSKLLKCEDFIFCNNCSRILYFPHYVQ